MATVLDKKEGRYSRIYQQLKDLLKKSNDPVAKMATICAVLFHKFDHYFWCGFYLIKEGELVVGPYQGPVACQVLKKDIGVCWASIHAEQGLIVPDVNLFPGHIACDSRAKSEITVVVKDKYGKIYGVLDVDSDNIESFDDIDMIGLQRIISLLEPTLS